MKETEEEEGFSSPFSSLLFLQTGKVGKCAYDISSLCNILLYNFCVQKALLWLAILFKPPPNHNQLVDIIPIDRWSWTMVCTWKLLSSFSLPYRFPGLFGGAHRVPEEGCEFSASDFWSYPLAANISFSFMAGQRLPQIDISWLPRNSLYYSSGQSTCKDYCNHLLIEVNGLDASKVSLPPW